MASTLYTTYSVDGVTYLYDTHSNAIMKAPPVILEELEREKDERPDDEAGGSSSALADLRSRGFLRQSKVRRMGFYSRARLRHRASTCVQQLTLEVTQVCNFRCGYCPFTYDQARRSPAATTMTFAIARRAIDAFCQLSTNSPSRTVSFWGGEPLANLALIREATEYAHDHAGLDQALFSFTTNATLITLEIARFLARYRFDLLVSLDGPRTIHDRQRRKVNGAPTFDAVTRGLQLLRDVDPDYYRTVRFNCVVARDTDLEALQDFFETFELTAGHEVTLNPATHQGLPDAYETERFGGLSAAQWACARRHFVSRPRDAQGMPDLIGKLCGRQFQSIAMRARRPLRTAVHPNGCCVPLLRKMVVTVTGDVLMCEQSPTSMSSEMSMWVSARTRPWRSSMNIAGTVSTSAAVAGR